MVVDDPFRISFSGISIRFIPFAPVGIPEEFLPLLTQDTGKADAEYEIRPLRSPLDPQSKQSHPYKGAITYRTEEGWLRIYSLLRSENGCQVACLLCPDNKNTLFYPAELWEHYTRPMHCSHLIGMETLLIQHSAFLLHSSVVVANGKAVLFSGPSGVGKSTQAALWHEHLGADILNGDRCVITERPDGFYGGGSPLAGHSGIYRSEQAPIAGIFLLEHGQENTVQRLGADALPPLLSQTLINSWDSGFMEKLTELYQQLLSQIPVYRLSCRPDRSAAQLAYDTLF